MDAIVTTEVEGVAVGLAMAVAEATAAEAGATMTETTGATEEVAAAEGTNKVTPISE